MRRKSQRTVGICPVRVSRALGRTTADEGEGPFQQLFTLRRCARESSSRGRARSESAPLWRPASAQRVSTTSVCAIDPKLCDRHWSPWDRQQRWGRSGGATMRPRGGGPGVIVPIRRFQAQRVDSIQESHRSPVCRFESGETSRIRCYRGLTSSTGSAI